jgi:hypothetical protein
MSWSIYKRQEARDSSTVQNLVGKARSSIAAQEYRIGRRNHASELSVVLVVVVVIIIIVAFFDCRKVMYWCSAGLIGGVIFDMQVMRLKEKACTAIDLASPQ